MAKSSITGWKTLWEKGKLLFSNSVLKNLVLQTRKNQGLFWKSLKKIALVFNLLSGEKCLACLSACHLHTTN